MDTRFHPEPRGKDCLNCRHHAFDKGVLCNHPSRPDAPAKVVRWATGCQQHETKKD